GIYGTSVRSASSSLCSVFFSLLLPSPLSSTLFPYTTLFRSGVELAPVGGRDVVPLDPVPQLEGVGQVVGLLEALSQVAGNEEGRDRKSTRLNSSHGSISYAVFCLKKKMP